MESGGSIGGGMAVSGWGGGCFCQRVARVESEKVARASLEQTSLTAPLKSPSSSLEDTRSARKHEGSFSGAVCLPLGLLGTVVNGGSASSAVCLLITVAKDHREPPLVGAWRHLALNRNRQSHEAWSLAMTRFSMIDVSFPLMFSLDTFGTLLTILTDERGGRETGVGDGG